jgi:hypothetical protein
MRRKFQGFRSGALGEFFIGSLSAACQRESKGWIIYEATSKFLSI